MSTLSIFQIALALVALFFLASGSVKFIKQVKSQTLFKFFMTIVIWGGVFFFAIFPKTAQKLSSAFGLGDNLNTLIFLGFVVIFIIIFKLISLVEKLERNISEIVRKEALEKIEPKA